MHVKMSVFTCKIDCNIHSTLLCTSRMQKDPDPLILTLSLSHSNLSTKSSRHITYRIFQVPAVLELEAAMHQLLRQRTARRVQRRQDDIKDESAEFSSLSSQSILKVFITYLNGLIFFFSSCLIAATFSQTASPHSVCHVSQCC